MNNEEELYWHPCGDPDNCCLSQIECLEAAGMILRNSSKEED